MTATLAELTRPGRPGPRSAFRNLVITEARLGSGRA